MALPFTVSGHPDLLLQIERLDEQIKTGPANAELYLQRGDLYRRHGDFERAAGDFAAARQLDPGHPLLDFYEGWLMLDGGDPASAEKHLARYLSTTPQHAKAWVLRGRADIQLARPEQAAECFGHAIATSEHPSPDLYRLQILSTLATGESGWEAAALIAASAVERFGTEVTVLGLATDIALAMNQPRLAAGYLDKLPPALNTLPQWSARFGLVDCFDDTADAVDGKCLSRATESIDKRVTIFTQSR